MSDESTLNQGGSEALPATNVPAPNNDAEAALQQVATPPVDAAKQAENAEAERKKNRTKDYIDRINRERSELAAENARLKAGSTSVKETATASDKEPSLEDFNWDMGAYNTAHAKWAVDKAFSEREQSTKQAEDGRRQQETVAKYEERLAAFAEDHPDFVVTVGSIPYPLPDAVQAAIMAHERGPEIAYHLGNNDDDAFNLSNVLPHVAAAAVDRLAKRLTAAPDKPEEKPAVNALAQPQTPTKPITRAPQPTATVTGRTPTETPSEKLTDDEWYRKEQERRRKR